MATALLKIAKKSGERLPGQSATAGGQLEENAHPMCGIVGYVGARKATPILLDGLERLEYRGYDSAGIAVITSTGELQIAKTRGKLQSLRSLVATDEPVGVVGIGHTRWATHGRPNDVNAHPHSDCADRITVVHNGIIENYASQIGRAHV